MVTTVIGIPNSEGIVRISCGGDIVEIKVVLAGANSSDSARGRRPRETPGGDNSSSPAGELPVITPGDLPTVINPGDLPATWLQAPSADDGRLDAKELIERIRKQIADPAQANPEGVVVVTPTVNLHDLARLHEQFAPRSPRAADRI